MLERWSLLLRSRLNFTASASSGVPSWNSTPERMFSTSVLGSVNFHDSARPGIALRVGQSNATSVSKIG